MPRHKTPSLLGLRQPDLKVVPAVLWQVLCHQVQEQVLCVQVSAQLYILIISNTSSITETSFALKCEGPTYDTTRFVLRAL